MGGKNTDSTVNGIPVVSFNKDRVAELFRFYKCDTLLFLSTSWNSCAKALPTCFCRTA